MIEKKVEDAPHQPDQRKGLPRRRFLTHLRNGLLGTTLLGRALRAAGALASVTTVAAVEGSKATTSHELDLVIKDLTTTENLVQLFKHLNTKPASMLELVKPEAMNGLKVDPAQLVERDRSDKVPYYSARLTSYNLLLSFDYDQPPTSDERVKLAREKLAKDLRASGVDVYFDLQPTRRPPIQLGTRPQLLTPFSEQELKARKSFRSELTEDILRDISAATTLQEFEVYLTSPELKLSEQQHQQLLVFVKRLQEFSRTTDKPIHQTPETYAAQAISYHIEKSIEIEDSGERAVREGITFHYKNDDTSLQSSDTLCRISRRSIYEVSGQEMKLKNKYFTLLAETDFDIETEYTWADEGLSNQMQGSIDQIISFFLTEKSPSK